MDNEEEMRQRHVRLDGEELTERLTDVFLFLLVRSKSEVDPSELFDDWLIGSSLMRHAEDWTRSAVSLSCSPSADWTLVCISVAEMSGHCCKALWDSESSC
ncbi:hypothetical protein XENOCAPTIV_024724 [Xenoophorus captivus]|uniref:Uncharacterized protein n=1 Tax=Xenoophorus captivus TaxID=1517983 RepID=A0ABV0RVK8_9TELE